MVKLLVEHSSPIEVRQRGRAEYRRGAEAKVAASRAARRKSLESRKSGLLAAVDAYTDLTWNDVHLRAQGLVIATPRRLPPRLGGPPLTPDWTPKRWRDWERATRRPLAAMAGHRGNALNFYLTMMFDVACQNLGPGEVAVNRHPTVTARDYRQVAWAKLCGLGARPQDVRARREVMARALKVMGSLGVIEPGVRSVNGSFVEGFGFRHEAGNLNPAPYIPPRSPEPVITLPREFFTNGWNLVLTSAEIGMLLTVMDAYKRFESAPRGWFPEGVELTQHLRHTTYGISSETYESLHTLAEFSLIKCTDPMTARVKGKLQPPDGDEERDEYVAEGFNLSPVPYRLRPNLGGLGSLAYDTVHQALGSSLPPRMQEFFSDYDSLTEILSALLSGTPTTPLTVGTAGTPPASPSGTGAPLVPDPAPAAGSVFIDSPTPGPASEPAF